MDWAQSRVRPCCRIWWPDQLQLESGSSHLLFGWLFARADTVDVVVAAAISQDKILQSFRSLNAVQGILHSSNRKMPTRLQESATFTILGHFLVRLPRESETHSSERKDHPTHYVQAKNFASKGYSFGIGNGAPGNGDQDLSNDHKKWKCGCSLLDGFMETHRTSLVKEGNWAHLYCKSGKSFKSKASHIPELHHLHLDGHKFEISDCHVIIYDVPTYGKNHFSLSTWDSPHELWTSFKKPNWINDLQKKPLLLDLDPVVLALNCSDAARLLIDQQIAASSPVAHYFFASTLLVLVKVTWHPVAICVASVSTIVYIFLQLFHKCLSHRSKYFILQKVFGHSWKNIHLRSSQILYWPIFLRGTALSSNVNVEYAHKAALRKHAVWSNVVMDVLMGLFFGMAFLLNIEAICFWTLTIAQHMTDSVLRSGCVWLMGVPAGFKLNTELAELLGMISLNAIQIYSTLWFFVGGFLRHIIQGLALSGILLGLTVPVSFCIDIIQLATLHVTTLQQLISFIYSKQIQAVASLWRLFRGRKWNPLRQRLDSYDYTVEQHVVGSLLFTPVLLLLPTTTIFYIFFCVLNSTIICICIMMEIVISIIHATPYAELILWLTRRRRFPSGLWFLTVSLPPVSSTNGDHSLSVEGCTTSDLDGRKEGHLVNGRLETLVSVLHCNYATFGQAIEPHYRKIFQGVAFSLCKLLAYGILSGERSLHKLHHCQFGMSLLAFIVNSSTLHSGSLQHGTHNCLLPFLGCILELDNIGRSAVVLSFHAH